MRQDAVSTPWTDLKEGDLIEWWDGSVWYVLRTLTKTDIVSPAAATTMYYIDVDKELLKVAWAYNSEQYPVRFLHRMPS